MKKLLLFILLAFGFISKSQSTYSPSAGNTTVSLSCGVTHTFVDAGGSGANYGSNLNYTVTFVPATPGQCLRLAFNTFSVHTSDQLSIFDGPTASSNSIGTYSGSGFATAGAPVPVITSTSGALTFVFTSNNSNNIQGWEATIQCTTCLGPQISMSAGSQTLNCGTIYQFFDSGGQGGNYSNNENITQTFYPSTPGSCMNISFQGINTANNDILSIYNGTSTASPLIGTYVNQALPPTFNSSGPVTFQWTSNGTNTRAGWYALIQCTACPAPITQTVTCGSSLNFFDTGGAGGNYGNNENYTVTVVPSVLGQCLALNFTSFSTNSSNDVLSIYDGGSSSAPLIGNFFATNMATPNYTSSGGALTFVFQSDGSGTGTGWAATISCVNCSVTSTTYLMNSTSTVNLTCPSNNLFYDSGGSGGNYANSQNFTKTFTAPPGSCLQAAFSSAFNLESCCDKLRIYDGPTGASPLVGTYAGVTGPGIIQSTGTSLTFSFTSDASVVYAGWEATITCVAACTGTPNGGNVTTATSPCPSSGSVGLVVSLSSAACGLTYQWQSAPSAGGPWTNVGGATGATLSVPTSTTTYYRRLTTCGANTGTSTAGVAALSSVTCSPSYTPSGIAYSFSAFSGILTPTTDDVLFSNIALFGFPVCYNGVTYWGGYIASNTSFVFDAVPCFPNIQTTTYAGPGVSTGWSINGPAPNTNETPRNAVLAPWHDAYPPAGGVIQYTTVGTAPNRVFIASWENIPMFSCSTSSPSIYHTSQVKIYETSNNIEIHVGNKGVCPGWNDGQAIMGLHNFDGTVYTGPVNATAHNALAFGSPGFPNMWSMSNTAYRFTPNSCASGGSGCLTLPITLKSFYGERVNKVNHLYWELAGDKNTSYFEVERSEDAINFEVIGKAGYNTSKLKYNFDDDMPKPGVINYYRIAVHDASGQVEKTFIYPLGFNDNDVLSLMTVHPNPSKDNYTVDLNSKEKGNVTLKLINSFGQVVKQISYNVNTGYNKIEINATDLPQGVYILSIENNLNEVIAKQKLIKQ